jgi:ribonuclease G
VGKFRERDNEGFIIRTQAPFATTKQLRAEAKYLKTLYEETLAQAKDAPVGKILYEDEDLPVRVMRDSYGDEISAIHVGDTELFEKIKAIAKMRGDIPERKLRHHTGERSMLKEYGITPLIYEAANPVVPLSNGGSIVIEYTEAIS